MTRTSRSQRSTGYGLLELLEDRVLLSRPLGIDVSSYQGSVDWTTAYNNGVLFAYAKATEGSSYVNPDFTEQMSGTSSSVVMGAYDFADFNTTSATTEAAHFLSVAGSYVTEGYLRPALDMEGTTSMTQAQVSAWVESWANYVYSHTNVLPVVYASESFAATYFNSSVPAIPSQFWEADYNGENLYTGAPGSTTPYSTWTMWQVSSTGSVPGVSGDVDLDTYNGTISGMIGDGGVVASAGAKFNKGDVIEVTASGGQKAWNTYATNGTYVTEPDGEEGTVESSTPVFIKGYERIAVKWNNSSSITWCADNLESKVSGSSSSVTLANNAANKPASQTSQATFSNTSVIDSLQSGDAISNLSA